MSSPAVVASAAAPTASSSSSSLDAQLIAATRDGKGLDECKALIEKGARVNAKNSNRNTALHYAARYGQDNTAKLLLDHGAMANVKNSNGWTPLHEAANNGHIKLAKLLLQQGKADCNSKGMGGYTPLHEAAIKGHVSMVHVLLDHGANVLAKNNEGKTVHDVASRGLTSMDLHLYKALQPTRSAMAKLTATCQQQQQELVAIKDHMARQRKADFDTLRRETHHVQQSLQQLLAQQAAKHEEQMQTQRNEFLTMLGRNNGGSISTATTTRQQVEQPEAIATTPAVISNEYNASAKLPSPTSLEEKSLQKSPSMASASSTASSSGSAGTTVAGVGNSNSNSNAAAAADTTALALQRLVLQRNNDMSTLRREIQGTQESLAKLLREQVEERVKKAIITSTKSPKQETAAAGDVEVTKNVLLVQEEIQSLRQEQERQAKVLQNITSSSSCANTNVLGYGSNDIEKASSGSASTSSGSDLRQEVAALRDEFAANKENVQAEMSNLKKEILRVQKSSGNNAIAATRSRSVASSTTADVVVGDDTTTTEDGNHLKQLQRKKSEKEEAAILAMRDAFMSKHQADLDTLRLEIMAAEENLMGLIQQQKTSPSLLSSSSSSSSSSNYNKNRSMIPETANNQDQDESTCQGEEGDYVTHEELKKSLQKKTKKQDASLAELREEFTKLMEFLEHVDVGSLRDDMMELVNSQVEQHNAAIAELREAIVTHQQPQVTSSPGLPPIQESKKKVDRDASSDDDEEDDDEDDEDEDDDDDDEDEEEDDGSLEELKKTMEIQAEAQRKALIALGDKLSLQRQQDMTVMREKTASTREQLEKQMQQQAEQQETMIAALREEMSTGVVRPLEHGGTLNGVRDEIKEIEESIKVLIHNQSKKQAMALAALQKKMATKDNEIKSVATDEMSLQLIQKQHEEMKAQQEADISTLKSEIDATKASLENLRDQQESNQMSAGKESRNVGTDGDDDTVSYENLKSLVEEQEKELRAAITMLQKDLLATNEKLNQLSAEHESKSVTASPSQTGSPNWSPRSLISPLSPKSRSSRDIVNAAQHEQGTAAPSDESLKRIQKEQEELKAQQQADIANLQKEINSTQELLRKLTESHVQKPSSQTSSPDSTTGDEDIKKLIEEQAEVQRVELANLHKDIEATKDRLEEIAEQQQQNDMAALEEKFIAKEKINKIIQRSLIEQDSQREAQMKSLLRTQEELDELIKSLEEHGGISPSEKKDPGDNEQEYQLRTDMADLRAMVSNYLLALKETMEEIAALREQVDAKNPDEDGESDASSKDSEMLDELDRMFDAQSEELPNETDVTLQEELRKVTAELRMVQAVADRYKETVMKLHKISEQALS